MNTDRKIKFSERKTFFFNVYSSDLVSNMFELKYLKINVFYDFENPYTINLNSRKKLNYSELVLIRVFCKLIIKSEFLIYRRP